MDAPMVLLDASGRNETPATRESLWSYAEQRNASVRALNGRAALGAPVWVPAILVRGEQAREVRAGPVNCMNGVHYGRQPRSNP